MKSTITRGLKAVLPQSSADSLFRLGVKLAPEEFRRVAFETAFAPEMNLALRKLAARGFAPRRIADVGSFHGDWSRMVKAIWPAAELEMIEANTDKRETLEPVAQELGAQVHFALLGPQDGQEVVFHVMESGSSVLEENSPLDRRTETRATRTLDTVLAGRQVDLLKLDVQGFELEVLKGGAGTLKQSQALILEVSLLEINKGAPLFAEVVGFMHARGFEVCDILELHRRPLDKATNQVDILFVPSASAFLADKRHF
ncbi:FkbM family methyltransferase [Roseobacter weihaiensis]|uniref:FkbM family methyltransferase n=1 Tax=Roseobacter weihaiensis TaxID=2763262 RepID=UPI001D0B8B09|nr:FkbM family methyltransferase [Roseobacter sp. H9]